jgi:hypothetical protein
MFADELLCCFREVCVESAAQPLVGGNKDQQVTLIASHIEQWMMKFFVGPLGEFT